ncbi:MAG TPA: LysM peptidoglycan-binding domain-containing protein [Trebonia sp.]|nr:LysM peptidoglycan-binding domain-containing protein [Trebonia sp.]
MKLRRRGRHAAPSQVEKVAAQAGKAAPAVAIAGALVVPAVQAASASAATLPAVPVAAATSTTAAHPAGPAATLDAVAVAQARAVAKSPAQRAYTVRAGDTLSKIASRFYHQADDWQYLYQANDATIANPDVIRPGQRITIPASPPAPGTPAGYQPRHSKPAGAPASAVTTTAVSSSAGASMAYSASPGTGATGGSKAHPVQVTRPKPPAPPAPPSVAHLAHYSCSSLETLWKSAGGNAADAFMAAEIAMAESGGNPNAHSPTNDYGLWQINGVHGAMATYDPVRNAKAAISISGDGSNWRPWTTYTSGAYRGKC